MAAAVLLLSEAGSAQTQRGPAPSSGRQVAAERGQPGSAPPVTFADDADARETRERLEAIFEKYPPSLAGVFKLDPTLLSNETYLAPYPALSTFLAQHPEIPHNPAYFFSNIRTMNVWEPRDERRQAYEMIGGVLAGIAAFFVFIVVVTALGWVIRTTINYRRWNRLSKIQTEVHTKLLDRFTQNEDLIAYMQTPAGKRFLESAPIPLDTETRPVAAPISRILWSLQAGVVLLVFGIGLVMLSSRLVTEVATAMSVFGTMAIALGAGFIISSIAAYFASRRFGLFDTASTPSGTGSGVSSV
jgi:hypothetical protein